MNLRKNEKPNFDVHQPVVLECTIGELIYMLAGIGYSSCEQKLNYVKNIYPSISDYFTMDNNIYGSLLSIVNDYLRKEGVKVYDDD